MMFESATQNARFSLLVHSCYGIYFCSDGRVKIVLYFNPYNLRGDVSLQCCRLRSCFILSFLSSPYSIIFLLTFIHLYLFLRFLIYPSNDIISAVFQLPEGKMLSFFGLVPKDSVLDIPNGILGMIFYIYVFLRCNMRSSKLVPLDRRVNAIICSLALASSIFLARKLYVIKEICVVCLTTHVINTIVFYRAMLEITKKQKDKIT
jgi:hypothetical protein